MMMMMMMMFAYRNYNKRPLGSNKTTPGGRTFIPPYSTYGINPKDISTRNIKTNLLSQEPFTVKA
jgi:hypothetical protein